jgi:CHAT domain-containing protein
VSGDEASRAFGSSHADYAADLIAVQMARGRTLEAFHTLEESRAQGLLELMSERRLSRTEIDSVLWSRLETAELALQKAGKELAACGEQLAELQLHKNAGASKSGSNSDSDGTANPRTRRDRAMASYTTSRLEQERLLEQVRRSVTGWKAGEKSLMSARAALPPGSLFLAWQVGERQSFVFIVSADSSHPIQAEEIQLGENALRHRVEALRQEIVARRAEPGSVVTLSRELCRLILPPAARQAIDRSDRVVLCPDGPLWDLPFAALVMNAVGDLRWLGLEKPLSCAQSLATFQADRERTPAANGPWQGALVVGDPDYAPHASSGHATKTSAVITRFSSGSATEGERSALFPDHTPPQRIPGSAEEARAIAALYGTKALVGEAATEIAVRERISNASVVHLATHGYFTPNLPMSSGVLLTPPAGGVTGAPTTNDGALQAWEFGRSLPLSAELVVLSACETGRGAKVKGEGLVGLTRSLQGAGARSVAATLWNVPDEGIAWLMLAFHRELTNGVAKDEALRRAMAKTAGNSATSSPYYWAACLITGDADRPIALAR